MECYHGQAAMICAILICLQAALPPSLSTHHFEIGAFPLNFVANIG